MGLVYHPTSLKVISQLCQFEKKGSTFINQPDLAVTCEHGAQFGKHNAEECSMNMGPVYLYLIFNLELIKKE